MDGLDLSAIDQIDQDVFNGSPLNGDDEDDTDLPLPDCIGIDSAVQDAEQTRLKQAENKAKKAKTRSEMEDELELRLIRPDSIRHQILEQSLKNGHCSSSKIDEYQEHSNQTTVNRSHVMNIVEKAGMGGIDKEKINEIIHEASKGSLFYKKQAQRQEEIHKSIEKMLNKVKVATPLQVANARVTCDKMIEDLKKQRVFNRVIVHFDLDMFFAAVEIRDNPNLADKPVAVGGDSMVSTSNYIARRFGVRAAMPGFIARKLCPELLLIKPNGFKYRQASSEVFAILEQYDPELTGMSLDEAYLDLTDYVKNTLERDGLEIDEYYDGTLPKVWWSRASEVVQEIRKAIYDKTKLTCSAGIACNTLLAKISTDINKPDGQFMVQGYPKDIMDFIEKTPVGKVSGIGKVSGQFLNALEIKTCGDIYTKRHYLPLVFYEINIKFYLRVALGDGATCIKSDEQRKSKSVERTFTAIKDPVRLLDKLDSICEELCVKYLKPYRIRGRTITIKLKRNTFTTTTKSYSMLVPTNDKMVIYSAAKNLLLAEIADEPPEISYRLLGVKLSNLADEGVTTNQITIDAMLRNQELSKTEKSDCTVHHIDDPKSSQSSSDANEGVETMTKLDSLENSANRDNDKGSHVIVDLTDENVDLESRRKIPATKTIENFFPCSEQSNYTKTSLSVSLTTIDGQEDQSRPSDSPNEMSEREQRKNDPNDEDFQCPYCFKPYSDFVLLEIHVNNCFFKTSIDVNKSFFSQRAPLKSPATPQTKGIATQPSSSKKFKGDKQTKLTSFISKPGVQTKPKPNQPRDSTNSKVSFYQKFIESNSQTLSQSPKVEPLQCPYCLHGFLSFESLEAHVFICTKNTSKCE